MQIRDEDLQSAGNQEKASDLQIEDQIEDEQTEEVYEEQMETGLQVAELEPVSIFP